MKESSLSDQQRDLIWRQEEAMFNTALGAKIALARKAAKMSQAVLAARSGLPCAVLALGERGRLQLGLNDLQRIADGIGVTSVSLLPRD